MKFRMLLLVGGAALALVGVASAQAPAPAPTAAPVPARPAYPALPPGRIAVIVRASGFDPLFRPMRQGDTYVLRALDHNEVEYRLVLDAYTGRTISIHALGGGPYAARSGPYYPGPYRGGPAYGPYRGPVYGRLFGPDNPYGPRPLPPRDVPQVRPPQAAKATQPLTPLPRPRPYVMEATSSIPADAPKPAEPQKTPPPPPAPQAPVTAAPPAPPTDAPPNNGGAAMPPVTPLD